MPIPWKKRITPYPAQQRAIFDPKGSAIVIATPKAGKTVAALQWLIEETERVGKPHRRFLWVSPTLKVSEIAFRRSYTELLRLDDVKIHQTAHTLTLPDETVIFFGSGDKHDLIYGEDYWGVVVDEATRVSLEAWIAITSTTQHTAARFRLIGNNVRRSNWAKKLAIEARKGELVGWTYSKLEREDAIAAGVISSAQDDMTRHLIPDDEYRILYEGSDVDDGGIHIDTYRLTEEPLPDMLLHARGWDLASTAGGDYTVGLRIAANSSGYWITDIVRQKLDAGDVLDLIARTAEADGPKVEQVVEQEKGASGPVLLDAIKRMLYQTTGAGPVYPAPVEASKQVRAWPFVASVGAGRYHFAPGFHNSEMIREFEEWPDSAHDDIVDAISAAHNHLAPLVEGMVGSGWVPGRAS